MNLHHLSTSIMSFRSGQSKFSPLFKSVRTSYIEKCGLHLMTPEEKGDNAKRLGQTGLANVLLVTLIKNKKIGLLRQFKS